MKLYTAEEAADILSVSKWTVWKYGREGKLRTVKFGRTVRYDLEGGNDESSNGVDGNDNGVAGIRLHGGGQHSISTLEEVME